jgi:hypothetical protein
VSRELLETEESYVKKLAIFIEVGEERSGNEKEGERERQ